MRHSGDWQMSPLRKLLSHQRPNKHLVDTIHVMDRSIDGAALLAQ